MIDIVDRLRELTECERPFIQGFMTEAADEVERLREQNKELLAALGCYLDNDRSEKVMTAVFAAIAKAESHE